MPDTDAVEKPDTLSEMPGTEGIVGAEALLGANTATSLDMQWCLRTYGLWPLWIIQVAQNEPVVNPQNAAAFRARIVQLAQQLSVQPFELEDYTISQNILNEFFDYRKRAEDVLGNLVPSWRRLASRQLAELLSCLGIDPASPDADLLVGKIPSLSTSEEIEDFLMLLSEFLSSHRRNHTSLNASAPHTHEKEVFALHPTKEIPTGLLDGADAFAHIKLLRSAAKKSSTENPGYVVLFLLDSLDSIRERLGDTAAESCLTAISAFLIRSIRCDDTLYYWDRSTLLAVMKSPAVPVAFAVAIQRIVEKNCDITLQVRSRAKSRFRKFRQGFKWRVCSPAA